MANDFRNPDHPTNHDLERQLDDALQHYLADPAPGIERRVLARAQAAPPRPLFWMRSRLAWTGALALAACLLAALFLTRPARVPAPNHAAATALPSPAAQPRPTLPAIPAGAKLVARLPEHAANLPLLRKPHRAAPPAPGKSNLPQLAVFPAPAPPTPQEQELATLAGRYPKQLEQATQPIPGAKPKPITIQPLQIKPITITPLSVARVDHQQAPISHHTETAP